MVINMKKILASLIAFILFISLLSGCAANKTTLQKKEAESTGLEKFQATANMQILQSTRETLGSDGKTEQIILYSEQSPNGMPQSWSLVVDDIEKIKLSPEEGLYGFAEVKFEDVDGDDIKEVLFYRQSTGSAGARGLTIYKTGGKDWQQLFSVNDPFDFDDMEGKRYEVKYLGDYYVRFEDRQTGLKTTIALDAEEYQGLEDMLKEISTWVDPIAEYSLVDYDGNGVKEIITIQRVIGIAHADTLAFLKTTYKLEQGRYKAVTLSLTDVNDKPLAEVKL
ncbi:hypothetical protein Desru_0863 [Desulforamulus ruminis DSM 2154]|uniref:Lipoprotein n=3 Tax=Desulforamulus ruminis TaxID=1564 RepID=F6DV74_DESRL|nr:hypothetical protein [Desulforamulus ruminis]AEG59140.1 hypothetical protein Desru_0863 [Desulforamulus ruminis DSM 2154]